MKKEIKKIITKNAGETMALGKKLAKEIGEVRIICLNGELGAGKTTFSQGFLRSLGIKGALTSPTFVVMKQYLLGKNIFNLKNIYHLDTYRVESEDVINLGWKEIVENKNNIILVEWPEKIEKIIPDKSLWLDFKWLDKDKREITFYEIC